MWRDHPRRDGQHVPRRPTTNLIVSMSWKRAAGLVLLTIVPACRTASIYSPDVQLHLDVQPASVRPGDVLRLEFTLSNPAEDSVVVEVQEDCRVAFMVLDDSSRVVVPSDETICMQAGRGRIALGAGGTWTARGEWRVPTDSGQVLRPGPYAIRAVLGEHYSVVRGKRRFKMSHAADTVGFVITPAR
jgi:hypothetical protein